MKNLRSFVVGIGMSAAILSTQTAKAQLLAYDPFDNTPGVNIVGSSGGGFGFNDVWQSNGTLGVANYHTFGLGYTDSFGNVLQTSGNAGFFQGLTSANSPTQPNRPLTFTTGVIGESIWISMLVVRQGPTGALANNPFARGVNITFDYNASTPGTNTRLGTGNGSGAATNTVAILSNGGNLRPSANPAYQYGAAGGTITNFIIMRVDYTAGDATADNAYLWVNPANLTLEPTIGSAATNVIGAFDYSFNMVRVFVGGNNGANQPYGEIIVDEIRIGRAPEDVMPIVPEPTVGALLGIGASLLIASRRRRNR